MPRARSASSFSLRWAMSSSSGIGGAWRLKALRYRVEPSVQKYIGGAETPPDCSFALCVRLVNLDDAPGSSAGGGLHFEVLADLLAEEGGADGRLVADLAGLGVSLGHADDCVD